MYSFPLFAQEHIRSIQGIYTQDTVYWPGIYMQDAAINWSNMSPADRAPYWVERR
jgi:hypothetical protein